MKSSGAVSTACGRIKCTRAGAAAVHGTTRTVAHRDAPVFFASPRPELEPVFDAALERVASAVTPAEPSLGLADVSGSMFEAKLGGAQSSLHAGDVSVLFSAIMGRSLGYAAGFSDEVSIVDA
jgi:ABC-type dipeptide/oligopeptide/nickel transport system permease subunit